METIDLTFTELRIDHCNMLKNYYNIHDLSQLKYMQVRAPLYIIFNNITHIIHNV